MGGWRHARLAEPKQPLTDLNLPAAGVDVNWENTFSAQVAKYLAVSMYIQWLYDKEIDKGGRFKETMALGLTWKLL